MDPIWTKVEMHFLTPDDLPAHPVPFTPSDQLVVPTAGTAIRVVVTPLVGGAPQADVEMTGQYLEPDGQRHGMDIKHVWRNALNESTRGVPAPLYLVDVAEQAVDAYNKINGR